MVKETSETALCQYLYATLDKELEIGGKRIEAGTEVRLLPQTMAECVQVPGERSLAEAWSSLSKAGHTHEDYAALLADYQTQLTRYADRLTAIETWAVSQGYTLPEE